ncbi:hypothetical protein THRCLA_21214, partial [Thraustotheca clavata]
MGQDQSTRRNMSSLSQERRNDIQRKPSRGLEESVSADRIPFDTENSRKKSQCGDLMPPDAIRQENTCIDQKRVNPLAQTNPDLDKKVGETGFYDLSNTRKNAVDDGIDNEESNLFVFQSEQCSNVNDDSEKFKTISQGVADLTIKKENDRSKLEQDLQKQNQNIYIGINERLNSPKNESQQTNIVISNKSFEEDIQGNPTLTIVQQQNSPNAIVKPKAVVDTRIKEKSPNNESQDTTMVISKTSSEEVIRVYENPTLTRDHELETQRQNQIVDARIAKETNSSSNEKQRQNPSFDAKIAEATNISSKNTQYTQLADAKPRHSAEADHQLDYSAANTVSLAQTTDIPTLHQQDHNRINESIKTPRDLSRISSLDANQETLEAIDETKVVQTPLTALSRDVGDQIVENSSSVAIVQEASHDKTSAPDSKVGRDTSSTPIAKALTSDSNLAKVLRENGHPVPSKVTNSFLLSVVSKYIPMPPEPSGTIVENMLPVILLEKPRLLKHSDLNEMTALGFGNLYAASYFGTSVVVKIVDVKKMDTAEIECYLNAFRIPRHPNIVLYFGMCANQEGNLCLVTEFMEGGSLDSVLYDPTVELSWQKHLLKIAKDVCRGTLYLHKQQTPQINGRLK